MSTYPQQKPDYETSLMKELMQLIQQYDNKAHNYFISTLLTGVLMHHLSWVHTVAPPEAITVSFLYCFIRVDNSYDHLNISISGVIMVITTHYGLN